MGWISDNLKNIGIGNIALNPLDPSGYAAAFGAPQSNGIDVNAGSVSSDDQALMQYINRINAGAGQGSYGEGIIGSGLSTLRDLNDQVSSGKMTQEQYLRIAGSFIPQIDSSIRKLSTAGSRGADAARNAGGDAFLQDSQKYNVYKNARELLGRDISSAEVAEALPYFLGPTGNETGRSYLAQLAKSEANSPAALRRKAGQYSGDVNRVFGDMLGRQASGDEAEYFGSLLASGNVSPYELQQYVRNLPEYRTAEDQKFRTGLNSELGQYDQEAFSKGKEDIISRYARQGQSIGNSPALDFALTNMLGDIAKERGRYLSGVSAQQYGSNKDAAREDYRGYLDNYMGNRQYETQRRDMQTDRLQDRSFNSRDYEIQRDDYLRMLNSQPRQKTSAFDYLNAGLNVANTGANVYRSFSGGY